ncbi:MAG: cyclic nucleotide-binding protein [Hyphomicrobiales bacterium]|nr:cyclic nucleotide-binding protein [Hyphomicrobiales bacterium]
MLQSSFRNHLIRLLSAPDFDKLRGNLEPVALKTRQVLVRAGAAVTHVYFPEAGQISVLAKAGPNEAIEVAMIGREGMTHVPSVGRSPMQAVVQAPGTGFGIAASAFNLVVSESLTLTTLLLKYQRCFATQLAFSALSHGSFNVEERLARWLLMAHDRIEDDKIQVVHEFMAWMLAVRRAGVTDALHRLREAGAIETGRGSIVIKSRTLLLEKAGESYGRPEAEYAQAFGV